MQFATSKIAPTEGVEALPPFYEEVFTDEASEEVLNMYHELYPDYSNLKCSKFYHKFGRSKLAGDLIGSTMPGTNSNFSSVIMSFWPHRGNSLATIDYGCKQTNIF